MLVRRLATVQAAIDVSLIETEPEAPAARARARSKTSPAVAPKRGPRPRGAARPAAAGDLGRVSKRAGIVVLALPLALSSCGAGGTAPSEGAPRPAATTPTKHVSAITDPTATARPKLRLVQIGSFEQPVYSTDAPHDPSRLFVVQRTGQVMLLLNNRSLSSLFLGHRRSG